jgi:hypothetical protein
MFSSTLHNSFLFLFLIVYVVFSRLIVLEQEMGKVSDRLATMLSLYPMGVLQIQLIQYLQTPIITHHFMCQKAW